MSRDFEVLGLVCCTVPGAQTVNRGELFATVLAVVRTSGEAVTATDSAYVQRPWAEDQHAPEPTCHMDLWMLLEKGMDMREGNMKICKVASHKTAEMALDQDVPLQ